RLNENLKALRNRMKGNEGMEWVRLVVPLPFEQSEYEKDFVKPRSVETTGNSRAEFRELLSRATNVIVMPIVEGVTIDPNATDPIEGLKPRDYYYGMSGNFVAQRAQVLFALWDGVHLKNSVGTSYIVKIDRQGRIEPTDP